MSFNCIIARIVWLEMVTVKLRVFEVGDENADKVGFRAKPKK